MYAEGIYIPRPRFPHKNWWYPHAGSDGGWNAREAHLSSFPSRDDTQRKPIRTVILLGTALIWPGVSEKFYILFAHRCDVILRACVTTNWQSKLTNSNLLSSKKSELTRQLLMILVDLLQLLERRWSSVLNWRWSSCKSSALLNEALVS